MPIMDSIQSNKQHAVPQNIMDVEFKLIGDLTMRQFAYLLANGLVAYICFNLPLGFFKIPTIIFFAVLGLGLAFATIEERGLDQWIVNFIRAVYAPTQRVWKKEPTIPTAFLYDSISVVKQELITLAPTSSRRKLEEFLQYQEENKKVDPLDIPEKEYALRVKQYMAEGNQPIYPAAAVAVLPEISMQPVVETKTPLPQTPQKLEPKEKPVYVRERKEKEKPTPYVPPRQQQRAEENIALEPLTPDMHSGRRFTSFVPSNGEIILPIRGERILGVIKNNGENDGDAREKAEKLQVLLNQIKEKEHITTPTTPQKPKPVQQSVPQQPVAPAPKVEPQVEKVEVKKQEPAETKPEVAPVQNVAVPAIEPTYANMQPLTTKPNIITGILKSNDGTPMQNMVVIVKNYSGDPVRAFKTNRLGEFSLATPLLNGQYTLEVSKTNNLGNQKFDIISIQANGMVIPPVEIVGRIN